MPERKSNDHELGKAVHRLIEQGLSRPEISRRLGISRYRIGRIAAAHGLPDAKTYAARRKAGQVLSERQTRILAFIQDYGTANSYSPSLREIAKGCDISSTSVVDYNLRHLEKHKYLTRVPAVSRTIVLTERGRF